MPTSELQRYTKNRLMMLPGGCEAQENIRPDWMITPDGERLELDFYIPSLNLAIEVQGRQHYEFVEKFHGDKFGYEAQLRRDKAKKKLCKGLGIKLIEIFKEADIDDLVLGLSYPEVGPMDYGNVFSPARRSITPRATEEADIDDSKFIKINGAKICRIDGQDLIFFDRDPMRQAKRLQETGEKHTRINIIELVKAVSEWERKRLEESQNE